jgi:hypothetical protein
MNIQQIDDIELDFSYANSFLPSLYDVRNPQTMSKKRKMYGLIEMALSVFTNKGEKYLK